MMMNRNDRHDSYFTGVNGKDRADFHNIKIISNSHLNGFMPDYLTPIKYHYTRQKHHLHRRCCLVRPVEDPIQQVTASLRPLGVDARVLALGGGKLLSDDDYQRWERFVEQKCNILVLQVGENDMELFQTVTRGRFKTWPTLNLKMRVKYYKALEKGKPLKYCISHYRSAFPSKIVDNLTLDKVSLFLGRALDLASTSHCRHLVVCSLLQNYYNQPGLRISKEIFNTGLGRAIKTISEEGRLPHQITFMKNEDFYSPRDVVRSFHCRHELDLEERKINKQVTHFGAEYMLDWASQLRRHLNAHP